jgi:hypothetical protein
VALVHGQPLQHANLVERGPAQRFPQWHEAGLSGFCLQFEREQVAATSTKR